MFYWNGVSISAHGSQGPSTLHARRIPWLRNLCEQNIARLLLLPRFHTGVPFPESSSIFIDRDTFRLLEGGKRRTIISKHESGHYRHEIAQLYVPNHEILSTEYVQASLLLVPRETLVRNGRRDMYRQSSVHQMFQTGP